MKRLRVSTHVVTYVCALVLSSPVLAAEFACPAGDVTCLIQAITVTNETGEANTILLAAGTYTLMAIDNDTNGPNGLPTIVSPLTIVGAGAQVTIIERAASAPPFRLVHIAASGFLTLTGLTLQRGTDPSALSEDAGGGGIRNDGGTLMLTDSIVAENMAAVGGGGIFTSGVATLIGSTLAHNAAGVGGGINNFVGGTLTLISSTLTGNKAFGPGGGLFMTGGQSIATLTASTVTHNTTGVWGGGIFSGNGTLRLTHSLVTNNQTLGSDSTGRGGGGLFNGGATVILTHVVVVDNVVAVGGGEAQTGGGVYNFAGPMTITSSLLACNRANVGGGLAHGAAPGGGEPSDMEVQHTFLALNAATDSGPECSGPITSRGDNLLGDLTDCMLALQSNDRILDPRLMEFLRHTICQEHRESED
jgi:hypothetical protein